MLVPWPAAATVVGSLHDFSWVTGTSGFQADIGNEDEVCIFCHTPHGATVTDGVGSSVPLWNKNLNRTAAFTMYGATSDTFNGKNYYDPVDNKPTGMTLLCLSCHDGVSTINGVLNYSQDANPIVMSGYDQIGDGSYPPWRDPNIGRDLSNDHPVSFQYNDALVAADTASRGNVVGLNPPGSVTYPGNTTAKLVLYNTKIECPTCHDPHEWGDPDKIPFLRMSNAGSGMCTTCHRK